MENHVEQQSNAVDALQAALGVADTSFNLDRLAELPARLDNAKFQARLVRTDAVFAGGAGARRAAGVSGFAASRKRLRPVP